jgi:arylsulfatase A-like enzyme
VPPSVIVIVVDRLGAGWLGPYGNTWVPTPSINRFAAQSLLCDAMLADAVSLSDLYQSYWTGLPALCSAAAPWPSLPQVATRAGLASLLITDSSELTEHPLAAGFAEGELLRSSPPRQLAAKVEHTGVAHLFRVAREAIVRTKEPSLLWIHAQAMNAAWDAPYDLREQFVGHDDPAPPRFAQPVHRELQKEYNPDELLGILQAYAAEVVALDQSLGQLLQTIEETPATRDALVVFTSPRGYALGEHLGIGTAGDRLHGEVLQTPLLVRFPGQRHRLTRLVSLHQPADLFATVAAELQQESPRGWGCDLQRVLRDDLVPSPVALAAHGGEWGIRTPGWFFSQAIDDPAARPQLYAKPDDRWEVNEISGRVADIAESFQECLAALGPQRGSLERPQFSLPAALLTAVR